MLLLSSQAVSSLFVDLAWLAGAVWGLFTHRILLGGMEYLFDTQYPLWVRLISSFHMMLPLALLWVLYRTGYDRRGWTLQAAIAAFAFVAARFTSPEENINYAFRDPFFRRSWGPAPVHLAVSLLFLNVVAYFPAHRIFSSIFSRPAKGAL